MGLRFVGYSSKLVTRKGQVSRSVRREGCANTSTKFWRCTNTCGVLRSASPIKYAKGRPKHCLPVSFHITAEKMPSANIEKQSIKESVKYTPEKLKKIMGSMHVPESSKRDQRVRCVSFRQTKPTTRVRFHKRKPTKRQQIWTNYTI